MEEKARLNRKVCESERSLETAGVVEIERHVEALGLTDRLRELKLMQSRDEPSGEKSLWGDSRAGAGYTNEIEFAHPELFELSLEVFLFSLKI